MGNTGTNTSVSTDPVILFDLTDSVFGDLTALPGDCTLTQLIEPGDDYTCSFNVGVFGVAGDTGDRYSDGHWS